MSENEGVGGVLYLPIAIINLIMSRYNYNRIKEVLAKRGKKNVELAKYIKKDPRTVSSWCSNYSQPEYSTLFKISVFLEVEAGELLTLGKDLRIISEKSQKNSTAKLKTKKRKAK